jgi:hypothetical protein
VPILGLAVVVPLSQRAKVQGVTVVRRSLIAVPSGRPSVKRRARSRGVTARRAGSLSRRIRFSAFGYSIMRANSRSVAAMSKSQRGWSNRDMGGEGVVREWDGTGHSFCTPLAGPVPTTSGGTRAAVGREFRVARVEPVGHSGGVREVIRLGLVVNTRRNSAGVRTCSRRTGVGFSTCRMGDFKINPIFSAHEKAR